MNKPHRILLVLAVLTAGAPLFAETVAAPKRPPPVAATTIVAPGLPADDVAPTKGGVVGAPKPNLPKSNAKPNAPKPNGAEAERAADRGLAWLAAHQLKNGGFGQGEESAQMGGAGALADAANVADTSIAAMAFLRGGSTPRGGEHQTNVARAVDYVVAQIEKSDDESIFVTDVRNTRVQSKLGQAIDTFMAVALLTEVTGKMPDQKSEARVAAALKKTLAKIERNQNADGSYETSGWAPVLAQGMAVRGLAAAEAQGYEVDDKVKSRAEKWSRDQVSKDATFSGKGDGAAGIGLYAGSANTAALGRSSEQNERARPAVEKKAKEGKTEAERAEARAQLREYDDTKRAADAAQKALAARANDERFIAGFGNNGGEEFLSYMLMAETLRTGDQKEFAAWHAKMQANLTNVQNGDGSWTGHHCITGRTFVTSSALLVMLADKAPATGPSVTVKKLTGGARG